MRLFWSTALGKVVLFYSPHSLKGFNTKWV